MEKIVQIGEKAVGFKATASTVKRYREKFNKDLFRDIQKIIPSMDEGTLRSDELECFMNIAYIMAWQYDNTIPSDPNDWLDQFEMFDIYYVLPEIIELWGLNVEQIEDPKKKVDGQSVK